MRIVLDMQGAQTESRFRGIGRYALSFAKAIVRNKDEHEIFLALNGLFPETIEHIRAEFDGLLPQENIRVWYALGPVRECQPGNEWRREVAERIREAFLASLKPDIIHVMSLFEGYLDDAVTSIGLFDTNTPVSVTLYDLIPLLHAGKYLSLNPRYEVYYRRKLEYLKRASLLLAISESSRREAIEHLGIPEDRVVNISGAVEPHFRPVKISPEDEEGLRRKFGISRPFVLYTGGFDYRKNVEGLLSSYAFLPASVRAEHQLVLVGKISEGEKRKLSNLCRTLHLSSSDVIFTGYVSDNELVYLYNLCKVFVFPSLHEGFGLPALEAMACGAAVIGSNTTSIREVIGCEDALFDPYDSGSMALKLEQVLTDDQFHQRLRNHGLQRAKEFSWDESARRSIQAWKKVYSQNGSLNRFEQHSTYHRLINSVTALVKNNIDEKVLIGMSQCLALNESAGVERQLLVDVSELSQRDAGTGVQRVVRSYLRCLIKFPPAGFRVEPVYATLDEGYRYARRFTARFIGLQENGISDEPIRWQRGDIFFGLDMQHHVHLRHASFFERLRADGVVVKFFVYDLLPIQFPDLFYDPQAKVLHEKWLALIARMDSAICISKSTADAYLTWIRENSVPTSPNFQVDWVRLGSDIENSSLSANLPDGELTLLEAIRFRPTFLCVSTLEPRKCQEQILDAVEILWKEGIDVNLVFVGKVGWKIEAFIERLRSHPELNRRLFWLSGISDAYLKKVYESSSCLIAASLNEGFGLPIVEAARHGIPIIARDVPVFHEVAGEHAFYFQGEKGQDLARALQKWLELYSKGEHPTPYGVALLTWEQSAEKLNKILVENCPTRQLCVDISELVQRDVKTGIQRVVRSILKQWLTKPPKGYRVEPVYATTERGYKYARKFTQRLLGLPQTMDDEPIEYAPGDIFFVLDLQPQVQVIHKEFFRKLRMQGVQVYFLVHDLLPVLLPECYPPGTYESFAEWLDVVAQSDGAVCVSDTTAKHLASWVKKISYAYRKKPFKIAWSHNGCDIEESHPTRGYPPDGEHILNTLRARPTFLMVGTLEPRKAHSQVLAAFEELWLSGFDVNLVIVGKQGWMVEDLVSHLRSHRELNKRLFWLTGVSDEYLEKFYTSANCLIMASLNEGFGLPLVEAARYKLPIIARDIPIFREVAGKYAFYFRDDKSPETIAKAVKEWLSLYQEGKHPRSEGMSYLTWKESAQNLLDIILNSKWAYEVMPDANVKLGVKYNHKSHRINWLRGWSHPEKDFRWTEGHEAELGFCLSEDDLVRCAGIRLVFHTLGTQRIQCYLNGDMIFSGVFQGTGRELILSSGGFRLNNHLLFRLPDARRPDNGDPRVLGIALREIEFITTEQLRRDP